MEGWSREEGREGRGWGAVGGDTHLTVESVLYSENGLRFNDFCANRMQGIRLEMSSRGCYATSAQSL
jgi:hypothetical protein